MERDIRHSLLDAIRNFAPTPEQMAVIEERERHNYDKRCNAWWNRLWAAVGTVNGCVKVGGKAYEIETLGYIVWLLHKRPMKGQANDIL